MAKRKLTPEEESDIKMLLANNEMLANTRKEVLQRGKSGAVKQIDEAMDDVRKKIASIDPESVKLLDDKSTKVKTINKETEREVLESNANVDEFDVVSILEERMKENSSLDTVTENVPDVISDGVDYAPTETVIADAGTFNETDPDAQYDIIDLPSGGQTYKSKIARVPVGYLTAYDENIITSPNLYKDGLVIDFLLKNKIMTKAISPDDLVSGDADAITLYLRATSYGPEFPIIVTDPDTNEQFETVVDLTKLKPREFKLVGDENGYFEFTTPVRKDVIKFRYLTRKQEKQLQKVVELESMGTRAAMLETEQETLKGALSVDDILNSNEKKTIRAAVDIMGKWVKKLREKSNVEFNRLITNNLQFQVMSVNGNTDRAFIKKYINNMPARDSLMLRRYINENTPGINFEIDVEKPESLGGGSFKTFLNWDDSVFLNISELRD